MEAKDEKKFRITPVQQMAAACSGALITSLIVTPLDVVKIRLQAQQKTVTNKCYIYCNGLMDHLCPCFPETGAGMNSNSHGVSQNWYERPGKYTGTFDAFMKISRTEGITSLWSGLSPTLVLAVPSTVVYFVSYEQLRVRLNDKFGYKSMLCTNVDPRKQPFWVPSVAGATARIWAATIVSPLELVRTKMQSKRLSYFEIGQALRSLIQYHGVFGLWKGLGSTLLRDVPFSAIYWVLYEWFKASVVPPNKFNSCYSFVGGAFAGGVAAFITTPFDVAKTHQQIELGEKEIFTGKTKKPNIPETQDLRVSFYRLLSYLTEHPRKLKLTTYSVLTKVYSQNGLSGVFAGLTPRMVKVAPACAIMVSSFEYGKAFFERYNRRNHMEL